MKEDNSRRNFLKKASAGAIAGAAGALAFGSTANAMSASSIYEKIKGSE